MPASDDAFVAAHGENSAAVEQIRNDREHGARWLARAAARSLVSATTGADAPEARLARTQALARELAHVRPSMAAIANTVAHIWWTAQQAGEPAAQLAAVRAEASAVEARWEMALSHMIGWARGALQQTRGAVYTLSRSSSVEGVLTTLARERASSDPLRVIVSESRPGAEGVALARALALAGAQVTLAVDAACATLIDGAGMVIVGADSIRADGAVVNKVGTRTLAQVALAAGAPVYALAETLKISPPSYPLVIEEMESEELLPEPVVGIFPRNIYFDVTPASLITGVVTEVGLLSASAIGAIAEQAERAYQALMRP